MVQIQIPVAAPCLPNANDIYGFLNEIDKNRIYSNFGPLNKRFESELSKFFSRKEAQSLVCTVNNATSGLILALKAQRPKPGGYCLLPSWTFSASVHAAINAGLVPYFLDVESSTQALNVKHTIHVIETMRDCVSAVMPTLPFGSSPYNDTVWCDLSKEYQIPVVIDAAAAFDSVRCGSVPSVVSMHATKVFPVGEGGCVLTTSESLINEIRSMSNFGFSNERVVERIALNCKLSEFHAAVGLAAFLQWDKIRQEFRRPMLLYKKYLSNVGGVSWITGMGNEWVGSVCLIKLPKDSASIVAHKLKEAGIDTRSWWGRGQHLQPVFSNYPREQYLTVTEHLANSTLGLPLFRGLREDQIRMISKIISEAL